MKRTRWGLAAVLLLIVAARVTTAVRQSRYPPAARPVSVEPKYFGMAPAFALTDQDGRTVRSGDLAGKPWVGAFIFTGCGGQCPVMTGQMKALSSRLPGVRFISFSVDPKDSPKDLKRFAKNYGADWTFLTGRGREVKKLSQEGFRLVAADGGPPAEPILHSNRFVLVDGAGRIRGYFDASDPAERDRLADAAARL